LFERDASASHLGWREIGEVLMREPAGLAPCLKDPLDRVIAIAFAGTFLRRQHSCRSGDARRRRSRIAHRHAFGRKRIRVVTPEGIEDLIERAELFVTLDQERATGVEDFVARLDVDVGERLGQIENSADRDIEANAAQESAEDNQVLDESSRLLGPRM
jgi:hypothetical protein